MAEFLETLLLITWFVVSAAFVSWIVVAWKNRRGRSH